MIISSFRCTFFGLSPIHPFYVKGYTFGDYPPNVYSTYRGLKKISTDQLHTDNQAINIYTYNHTYNHSYIRVNIDSTEGIFSFNNYFVCTVYF